MYQFTATRNGREVGTVEVDETTGSAAEIEERIHDGTRRLGRMALEPALQQVAEQASPPRCCRRVMHSRGQRVITVQSTFGEISVSRRMYCCETCGRRLAPADARYCCGRHRITRPLAQRACQLATLAHFTELPTLLQDQHGVTLSHDTLVQLTHDVGGSAERLRLAEGRSCRTKRLPPASDVRAPKRIWISVDGTMDCTNIRERDPQHPGKKRLVWQQMKVGCVAWEDDHGEWHKQLVWGRESPEEFGRHRRFVPPAGRQSRIVPLAGYSTRSHRHWQFNAVRWRHPWKSPTPSRHKPASPVLGDLREILRRRGRDSRLVSRQRTCA